MAQTPLSLYQYSDYRQFLNDYAQSRRRLNPRWSYGAWAKTMGLKTTASLTRVLSGTRHPGKSITTKLAKYFELKGDEAEYFTNLILLSKIGEDRPLATLLREQLKQAASSRGAPSAKNFRQLDLRILSVIAHWLCFALHEMIRQRDFSEDPAKIARRLHFQASPAEVRDALRLLQDVGLLKRDTRGKLVQTHANIEAPNDLASEASKMNHEQNLDHAKWALRNIDIKDREFNSVCLTVSAAKLPRAKEMIRAFKAQFVRELEAPDHEGDSTYQLQIQLFPYTKPMTSRSESL